MKLTRRFFLGGIAAAAALPTRPSLAAPSTAPVVATPLVVGPVPSPTGMWQDIARQIPATKTGDPVAYVTGRFMSDGVDKPMIQPDPDCRPTLGVVWQGQHYIEFHGRDQFLCAADVPVQKPAFKAGKGVKVFEIKMSSSTSAKALATAEKEMMGRLLK
jgi:hypothetical protein